MHECLAPTAPGLPQQLLGRPGAVSWDRSSSCWVQREIPLPRPLQFQPAPSRTQIKQLLGAWLKKWRQCLLWEEQVLGKVGASCSGSRVLPQKAVFYLNKCFYFFVLYWQGFSLFPPSHPSPCHPHWELQRGLHKLQPKNDHEYQGKSFSLYLCTGWTVNSGWEKLPPTEALQLPVIWCQIISYCSQTAPGLLIGTENTMQRLSGVWQ